MAEDINRGTMDKEAQEEAAQDYLRLQTDAEEETTLTGKRLKGKDKNKQ